MAEPTYVACDFGAESGRVILGRLEDGRLRLKELHRFPNRQVRVHGRYYWDPLNLFAELKKGLAVAARDESRSLSGVGVDTWGVDFGLIDAKGEPVGFPRAYRDPRTRGMMEEAFRKISRDEIYDITGIQFLEFNTVYQLLSMVREGSAGLRIARRLLFMPDLFNYMMTGEALSEYTIASTSQLLDARRRCWSERLFRALELPLEIMPPLIEAGTAIGPLLPEILEETGLREGRAIAPACHDTASAVAAVPARGDGDWAYLSSGTWSLVGTELDSPLIGADSLARNFTNEGGYGRRIRFLRNNMGLWLLERCKTAWEEEGDPLSYDELVELAGSAPAFRGIIDPDDATFLNPSHMPSAIVDFCRRHDRPAPESKGEIVRTILESLALKYRFILDGISELLGRPLRTLHVVGGGSRNELLNRFTADASGLDVLAGPAEATAVGNILIQAIASGELGGLEEARAVVRRTFTPKHYRPRERDAWEARFEEARPLFVAVE